MIFEPLNSALLDAPVCRMIARKDLHFFYERWIQLSPPTFDLDILDSTTIPPDHRLSNDLSVSAVVDRIL
jgi:hypothetical protein